MNTSSISSASSAAALSLAEQASLTSGGSRWTTTPVRDVVRALTLSDGPHGIRRPAGDAAEAIVLRHSLPATCFPPAVTLGSSWDSGLAHRIGEALAREASALGVDVVLGPGINIKRSPLCGRNFEYFSEDPHISGVMGAAVVEGIQSVGVGACVKHFAANNQETDRMRVSADVDERTLREIYLPAFEHVVREAKPYTVMCAYNKINGVHASENHWLLTQVLREEWGFDGLVMSDWGAVTDRVAALAAGLDLEMPPTGTDEQIVASVEEGCLDPVHVAEAANRVLRLRDRTDRAQRFEDWDADAHHELAREAARASAVLLKNEEDILPLDPTAQQTIAVIGEFARTPRYQGNGSSHVVPTRVDNALDALTAAVGPATALTFAAGFTLDGTPAPELAEQAVAQAATADVAVVFLGLPDAHESEGYDRADIDLPADQIELLREVAQVCPRVAVVLANGGTVSVSQWLAHAGAVLESWLPGQAGGTALADLILGFESPSGRLTETIPQRLADVPSHLHFPGRDGHVVHGEGRYVGYRHYDTVDVPVAYPFGHGLTYTTFAYEGLKATATGDNRWTVEATITNTGSRFAREVVQLYIAFDEPHPTRPRHELRGFTKVGLEPGASASVRFELTGRDLAWWSTSLGGWAIDPGPFAVEIGASSRDIRLRTVLHTAGDGALNDLEATSTFGEWLNHPVGGPLLLKALARAKAPSPENLAATNPTLLRAAMDVPLAKFTGLGFNVTAQDINHLVAAVRSR
ncbi:glycoside hydrolase family 3 C-terminal domain-containing protein [Streptomyces sp. NPDC001933]|uniref:glycoside hydrolase family 3 C-terminal domain-containing protein n=1 Tax=Streptomyces sp. NPDC001933 TaxID=3364626 RepID=UPI0036C4A90D